MVTLCPTLLVGDQLMFLQTVSVLYIWGHHMFMVTMEDMCILLWVSVYCSWWQYTVTIESGCVMCVCILAVYDDQEGWVYIIGENL